MLDSLRPQRRLPGPRLFERLANTDPVSDCSHADRLETVVESIKHHLVALLNSHPGSSESVPTLGLMDFNDATIGEVDLEINIKRAIRHCIVTFEPRVQHVEVETLPRGSHPLRLRFKVHATLNAGLRETRATIDLLLDDRHYLTVN